MMLLLTELRQYVTSRAIAHQLMKCNVAVGILFIPTLLDSLETLHCQRNKPLFVIPYGEKMSRNSLIEVRLKSLENFEMKLIISVLLLYSIGDTFCSNTFRIPSTARNNDVILTLYPG
jgi:hypothetical protein